MFVCTLATIVSAGAFKGAHNPKTLALWCLVFKLALLPFFLTMTLIVLVWDRISSPKEASSL